jgi:MFS family permease
MRWPSAACCWWAAASGTCSAASGGSYVAVFISGIAIFATFLFLTYYLQVIKRESPLATGLLFLPMIGCILISSNLSSIVGLARLGPRVLIAGGMLLGAGGMAYLTQVTVTSSYASGVLPALLILGLGFGMIFAPAINTATFGVARRDSGVASALVNTMQQVGGSIGTSALSTIALSTAASYLITHHTSPLAPAIAATHGYTVAFSVSAALLGLGCILAIVLLPSKRRLTELRNAVARPAAAGAAPATVPSPVAPAPQPAFEAIPVALCSCSPVVTAVPGSAATPVR